MCSDSTAPVNVSSPRRRARRGRWIAIIGGAIVLLFSVVLAATIDVDPNDHGARAVGRPVPTFDLPTVDGGRVSSRGLAGEAYIVNFWNSWCVPCREEHPALDAFYRRHATDPDFAMVGIVRDDTDSAVRSYVAATNMRWTIAFDPKGEASLGFGTYGQPETYAISPSGLVVAGKIGPSTVAVLEAMLAEARRLR